MQTQLYRCTVQFMDTTVELVIDSTAYDVASDVRTVAAAIFNCSSRFSIHAVKGCDYRKTNRSILKRAEPIAKHCRQLSSCDWCWVL